MAGQRTAVNLQGLDCEDVPRGSTVTVPGGLGTTRRLWARIRLLPGAPEGLRRGGSIRFHQATCERAARYRVLQAADEETLRAEVYLDRETVLVPGDRFILRRPAPVNTVGGGTVVDVNPPRPKQEGTRAFDAASLETENAIQLRLARASARGREPAELARELGLSPQQLRAGAEALEASESLVRAAGRWFDGETWRRIEETVLSRLKQFHAAEPLRTGLAREELRARTERTLPQEAWRRLLERLAAAGELTLQGDSAALARHEVRLSGFERELADRVEAAFLRAGLEPPEAETLVEPGDRERAAGLIDLLIARRRLVRIQDGKLFHAKALEDLLERLRRRAAESTRLSVSDFKALAGVTRKHAIPLLEYLDAQRVTRRAGNDREILLRAEKNGS
jgi:selenocysteine-specific elongation factor